MDSETGQPVTLRQIAREAGVSIATVSRALRPERAAHRGDRNASLARDLPERNGLTRFTIHGTSPPVSTIQNPN